MDFTTIIFFVIARTSIIMLSILSNPYFKIETDFNKFVIIDIYYKLKNILLYRFQLNPNPLEPWSSNNHEQSPSPLKI